MNCKNCGEILSGNFCSHCGQNARVDKISVSNLLSELSESIFQFNSGLLYTLKELFIRPGKSIQNFLNGKRKVYFKPIAYVLLFSTVYFLVSKITNQNTWMNDLIFGFSQGAYDSGEEIEIPKIIIWFADNYAYTALLLIPIFSFASYLCFLRFEANYLEHIVLNCYITGQQAILYTLFTLFKTVINSQLIELLPVLVTISYSFWVFSQLFKEINRIVNILRSTLTYMLYLIFSLGALMLLMVAQGLA